MLADRARVARPQPAIDALAVEAVHTGGAAEGRLLGLREGDPAVLRERHEEREQPLRSTAESSLGSKKGIRSKLE